jgi:hypothetical protein
VCFLASAAIILSVLGGCGPGSETPRDGEPGRVRAADTQARYDVRPGDDIQAALDRAAADPVRKVVRVHAGTYRPRRQGQAFVWLNARHDGITLEAAGEVVLTAANPAIADPAAESYPAVVNHVVYFGDGISRGTVLRGFKITGANNFVIRAEDPGPIQPDVGLPQLAKRLFFYSDGGGIKIFGRSYPTIENVEVYDNYSSPCGAGVSIEHRGFNQHSVLLRNAIFRNNRAQVTGAAVDVLRGSAVTIENCLFVGNVSNTGVDYIGTAEGKGYNAEHGSGALTVFPLSRVRVNRCTFTDNWNGVDDRSIGSFYTNSIFWMNNHAGGISPGGRYEIDIADGSRVLGCFIRGDTDDLRGTVDASRNVLGAPDPEFDAAYRPRAAAYAEVGYRPTTVASVD